MNAAEFWSLYYGIPVTAADLAYPDTAVEHVTLSAHERLAYLGGMYHAQRDEYVDGWAGAEVRP